MPVPLNSDEGALRAILDTGTEEDRWRLAGTEGLPTWVYVSLRDGDEEVVLANLALNSDCPPEVLKDLAVRRDGIAELARRNPNASPDTMDHAPLGSLSTRAVDRYLTARGATLAQRQAFADSHRSSPVSDGPSVGEAWGRIAGSS